MKAFFTVEATMLFPIILFVLSFLVYLGFYQYNRCIVEESMRYAAVRGKELSGATEEEYEDILSDLFVETLDKHYLIGCDGKIECERTGPLTNLVYVGDMPVLWLKIVDSGIGGAWQIKVKSEAKRWDPVSFIRLCNRMKGE